MEINARLLDEFKKLTRESPQFEKNCNKIADDITHGNLTIVQAVEQLGPLLIDTSPNNRELGTWILTSVLEKLPANHFNQQQLQFICAFYNDRLKDHHQVVPAVLAGILTLAKFEQFPNEFAVNMLTSLFHNVSCQQQQEEDRHNIFKIFDVFLDKYQTEMCSMGFDYVYGVISAVDGERNPRNLIFLFNWFPKFLKTVTLGHLIEEAFEILACYFPVDFKAPPQDPTGITRDQLSDSLAPCLTAIPEFAEFCFPLALEKLESSLEIAKLDALKLLEIGCSTFDVKDYKQHSTQMWSIIQKEIFSNPSVAIEAASLRTLSFVIKKIDDGGCVKDIADTIKGNLLPDSRLYDPSVKLLLSVGGACKLSSNIIAKETIPILVNMLNVTPRVEHKARILTRLVEFFRCYVKFNEVEFEEAKKVPLLCLKTSLEENPELRRAAFDNLSKIITLLSKEIRFSLYENFQSLLFLPQNHVRGSILGCFEELAKNYPTEVRENLIQKFDIESGTKLGFYLDSLSVIANQEILTKNIIEIFLFYLDKNVTFGEVAISYLHRTLEKFENNTNIVTILLDQNIVKTLVDWTLKHEISLKQQSLEDVSFVLKATIGPQTTEKQKQIVGDLPKIDLTNSNRVFLLDGILCCLRREVQIDYRVLKDLKTVILTENNISVENTAGLLLANILNKCEEPVLLDYLHQSNDDKTDLITWVTKALVMRNHQMANVWTEKLLNLLENDQNAAKCFSTIVDDSFDSLSQKSHCLKSILYQQKFFTIVSNRLKENYQPGRTSYLLALGYLLERTPKRVILLQFKKILKLVVLCLDECQDGEVLVVILQVIKEFIINKEQCVDDQFSDFLVRFLKLATFEKSMKVRLLALQCLQECVSAFPVYKLLIHKTEVLRVLGKVTDDKKRIVRKEAMETRSIWFLVDEPM